MSYKSLKVVHPKTQNKRFYKDLLKECDNTGLFNKQRLGVGIY